MRTTFRTAVAGLAVAGQLPLLAFCGAPDPPGIAIVVGQHANAIVPSRVPEIDSAIDATRSIKGARVIVVRADGQPTIAYDEERAEGNDNTMVADPIATDLEPIFEQGKAQTAEVDLLGAIDVAARGLSRSKGPKSLYIVDSGLQTAGALKFQTGLLQADPGEVAAYLQQVNTLPDLQGITVHLVGIGAVTAPQPPLPVPARRRLEAIWKAIIEASGAQQPVNVVPAALQPRTTKVAMPTVTVVPVVAPPPPQPCQLRADTLGFEPDRADLIDQAAAVAVLRTCLAKLGAARRIEVIGTTSSAGTEEGRAQLSQQRAEVIRDLLVRLGIAPARLTARGIGNNCRPPCVVDRHDGVLDPVLAVKNRLVIIRAG
ncbi:hypothetical protein GCM10027269_24020 [Kribbella endophytica]